MTYPIAGYEPDDGLCDHDLPWDYGCRDCEAESDRDRAAIEAREALGHTHRCAARFVWGGGKCECGAKKLTGEREG